jgi:two-component system, cell cycle sensor histidine kinase and response regulator CckA
MTDTIQKKELKGTTVLVVDDEPLIQDIVSMMIEGLGFAVLIAADGNEGLKFVEKHRQEIFLVLCDLSMPGMDGWQTITALRSLVPELPVVLASGYAVDQAMCCEHPDQPWAIMNKPYVFNELENLLQRALQERASVEKNGDTFVSFEEF